MSEFSPKSIPKPPFLPFFAQNPPETNSRQYVQILHILGFFSEFSHGGLALEEAIRHTLTGSFVLSVLRMTKTYYGLPSLTRAIATKATELPSGWRPNAKHPAQRAVSKLGH